MTNFRNPHTFSLSLKGRGWGEGRLGHSEFEFVWDLEIGIWNFQTAQNDIYKS